MQSWRPLLVARWLWSMRICTRQGGMTGALTCMKTGADVAHHRRLLRTLEVEPPLHCGLECSPSRWPQPVCVAGDALQVPALDQRIERCDDRADRHREGVSERRDFALKLIWLECQPVA